MAPKRGRKAAPAEAPSQKPAKQPRKAKGRQEKAADTQPEPEDVEPVKAVAATPCLSKRSSFEEPPTSRRLTRRDSEDQLDRIRLGRLKDVSEETFQGATNSQGVRLKDFLTDQIRYNKKHKKKFS